MVKIRDANLYIPARMERRTTTFLTGPFIVAVLLLLIPLSIICVYQVLHTTLIVSPVPETLSATDVHPSVTIIYVPPSPTPTPNADTVIARQYDFIQSRLEDAIKHYDAYDIAVAMIDSDTGRSMYVNAKKPMTAASTTKLITAVDFLSLVEDGTYDLNTQVGAFHADYQLQQLINQSNNDSWDAFHGLMGLEQEESFAHHAGLLSYDSMTNTVSPADIAWLLYLLYHQKILSSDHRQLLLSYMQQTDDEAGLPAMIPASETVYHKAGLLDRYIHDAAIIDDGTQPYILVIYSHATQDSDYDTQLEVFHQIAKKLFALKAEASELVR